MSTLLLVSSIKLNGRMSWICFLSWQTDEFAPLQIVTITQRLVQFTSDKFISWSTYCFHLVFSSLLPELVLKLFVNLFLCYFHFVLNCKTTSDGMKIKVMICDCNLNFLCFHIFNPFLDSSFRTFFPFIDLLSLSTSDYSHSLLKLQRPLGDL